MIASAPVAGADDDDPSNPYGPNWVPPPRWQPPAASITPPRRPKQPEARPIRCAVPFESYGERGVYNFRSYDGSVAVDSSGFNHEMRVAYSDPS